MKLRYFLSIIFFGLVVVFQAQNAFAACSAATCAAPKVCNAAGACVAPAVTTSGTKFTNPLKFSTVEGFLGSVMSAVQRVIVSLALVAIVIGALLYVTSAGNDKQITRAKEAITAALIGLALGIAAPSMLKELAGILGWGVTDAAVAGAASLSAIAIKLLNFLLGILGILSLIMMIIGSGFYLTSAGDDDRMEKGKEIVKYALFGVIMAMSAMVLVRQISVFFVTSPTENVPIQTPIDPSGLQG